MELAAKLAMPWTAWAALLDMPFLHRVHNAIIAILIYLTAKTVILVFCAHNAVKTFIKTSVTQIINVSHVLASAIVYNAKTGPHVRAASRTLL